MTKTKFSKKDREEIASGQFKRCPKWFQLLVKDMKLQIDETLSLELSEDLTPIWELDHRKSQGLKITIRGVRKQRGFTA